MATKKRTAPAVKVESDSTAAPNETQVAEQATQAVGAAAQATIATVASEHYDNTATGTTCTLVMSDGTKRTGRAKHEREHDPVDMAALQAAARADALGAA